ncbi:phosphoribosylanthranilate isomerase [Pseudoxanthomonas sp. SGNA-20]|uniref:N-(5'-phosphoribosyl)anthranilate isomerase n=1 Tax=Pseudoxanthomonas taiwanensis J19 TaxID=935569 RepID=A0A562DI43_9GAMM|nr:MULTISPECIES: phosphoribosylanthranilate isomerase [Pseudoxanthomonas]RRN55971.1 phosphoribosylanthranilate isomerase [Pseudoxanthomonas sp. SGNA-20]RRN79245.1 phosphoribosylanthranilate isomerase [Pseudoxanthomonas sp. SGD-10]TWH09276.1 phosphoribosylanthranilate isomerase [Pseudoxanthomonas taiwanensis J19]
MSRALYRTRIKFCGMTRPGDVRLASELGVDAVGFVFAEGSPRQVTPMAARQLRLAMAPLVSAVALFRNNSAEEVREVVRQIRPALLQFHGDEDDAFCRAFRVPYMKAIPMGDGSTWDAQSLQQRWPNAAAFLFDSHGAGGSGGSGKAFDWRRLPTGLHRPFVLAGGLDPDNVAEAIAATLPWAVDVASGIELSPGIKDGDRMRRFVAEVRRADCAELD